MPATTATQDPIRAEVERVLTAVIDLTIRVPLRIATVVPRCMLRRASRVGPLAEPLRVVQSMVDLLGAGAGVRGVVTPDDAPAPTAPAAGRAATTAMNAAPSDRLGTSADEADLPIEDYESLAASQVVDRLGTLGPDELRIVRDFETAHRGRRTVLGRIDQLLGMIDPTVRRADVGDVGPLGVLEAEARAGLADVKGGARWLDEHPLIGRARPDAVVSQHVFVAVLDVGDGGPLDVGYLVLDVDGEIARVDQVYVTAEARELGFGDALLEAATEAAIAAGAALLEGQALPGDRNTKNLYERAGITARLITVSRRL